MNILKKFGLFEPLLLAHICHAAPPRLGCVARSTSQLCWNLFCLSQKRADSRDTFKQVLPVFETKVFEIDSFFLLFLTRTISFFTRTISFFTRIIRKLVPLRWQNSNSWPRIAKHSVNPLCCIKGCSKWCWKDIGRNQNWRKQEIVVRR